MRTLLFFAFLLGLMTTFATSARGDTVWVFVGTYTGKMSRGIYRVELDTATGKLGAPELAAEIASPSCVAIHPNRTHLFCACEISDLGGKNACGAPTLPR